jgi:Arc/MetJ-type ribon-helix-helix transcriptional regulator
LAKEIEALVEAGWFASQAELARLALTKFVQRHRFELEEKFQREDIRRALELRHRAGYAAHPVVPGEFDAWD